MKLVIKANATINNAIFKPRTITPQKNASTSTIIPSVNPISIIVPNIAISFLSI